MLEGFIHALSPLALTFEVVGVLIGIVFGAIPGLTATLAIALFVPITFLMSPENGMIMLSGIYAGAIFGGSISAILLDVPGTPASIVTGWEGHTMAREGKAPLALSLAAMSSGVGGILSAVAVLFLTPLLSKLALSFGAPEYCALLVFSFAIVIIMLETPIERNFVSLFLGLLATCIGLDPVNGAPRFTFGQLDLMSGFNLVAVLLGFFCMSQAVFLALESLKAGKENVLDSGRAADHRETLREMIARPFTLIRASISGILLGILPAIGPTTTPFLAHAIERRFNPRDAKWGKGSITGLLASETSISANVGGSLVPLISLGIPGSGAAAVFIGALTLHGLQPGPTLFANDKVLIYTFFWGFMAVNVFMLLFGLFGARYFAVVLKVPVSALATFVAVFSTLGAYAINNSMFDVWTMLGATVIAVWFRFIRLPILPIVMAVTLGKLFEQQIVVMSSSYSSLGAVLMRPVADVFLLISIAMLGFGVYRRFRPAAPLEPEPSPERAPETAPK